MLKLASFLILDLLFFPEMSEYTKKYESPFSYPDGTKAYLYSPYD
ncbi:MAG TPA: hypothetical protein VD772_09310 [Anseongella sp.]|nr:hypothetical protein [Anseongella sp.]